MKKSIIAAVSCFAVGVVGLAISLPQVAGNAIELYNEVVVGDLDNLYEEQSLPAGITSLLVVSQDSRQIGQVLVEVQQSPDEQIHIESINTVCEEFPVELQSQDNHGTIMLQGAKRKNVVLNRESIKQIIYNQFNYYSRIILKVPSDVRIENIEADNVCFNVMPGVEFVNSDLIRQYGYIPNRLKSSRKPTEATTEQDNHSLIFPTDIIKKEDELNQYRDDFAEGDIDKEEYLAEMERIFDEAKELRIQQLTQAGKGNLTPSVEEIYKMLTEYNQVDAMLLEAQRSYDQGEITQEKHNKLVESYSDTLAKQNSRIYELKQSMQEKNGYLWDIASIQE